jgi:hypothetical protein
MIPGYFVDTVIARSLVRLKNSSQSRISGFWA